jgi:uncharacterized protein YdeI (YjbR/CyaY-like superfamily)
MPTTADKDDLPLLPFATPAAWEKWLAANHETARGVWLKLAKAAAGNASVTYAEALDVALCYGWIDGQKGSIDARYWKQRFTPRSARSKWSQINCKKVDALIAAGRMTPAGLREVEAAKADGRWERAYAGARAAEVPEDLVAALAANKKAQKAFATLDGANRYSILYHVHDAKKPETRAKRIAKYVAMLANGEKPHP